MGIEDYEVAQVSVGSLAEQRLDAIERANIDIQVSTAKAYPRDLKRAINNSIAMATMDTETAESCRYALPRGSKPITGPSVNLAKILVSCWGNIRTEAKVVQVTDTQVVSRGTCWDLENNTANAFEVRRSIVGKFGRYNDDMITVTGNAANSIAFRNAVFSVIPRMVTDKVYKAVIECITGDLSDENELIKRRTKALAFFKDEYGITEDEVVKLCGKQTVNQLKAEEIALMLGMAQSLKDGDTTVDDLMQPIRNSKEAKQGRLAEAAVKAAEARRAQATTTTERQPTQAEPLKPLSNPTIFG